VSIITFPKTQMLVPAVFT